MHENSEEEDSDFDEEEHEEYPEAARALLRQQHMLRQSYQARQLALHRKKHMTVHQHKQKLQEKKEGQKDDQGGNIPTVVKEAEEKKDEDKSSQVHDLLFKHVSSFFIY
jgi:hypothetical protein